MKKTFALLLTLLLFLTSFGFAEELIDTDFTFTDESPIEEPLPDEDPEPDDPQAKSSKEDFTWSGTTITGYIGSERKVVIPKEWGVTAIGDYAFLQEEITSISIPGTVQSIGEGAFEDCENLTSVTLASGITEIGDYAFNECLGLKSIKVPDSVTDIGDGAFSDCISLKSATLPKGLTTLPYETFMYCSALTSCKLPAGLQEIGGSAFNGCSSLKSISIPSGVTFIGGSAFEYTSLSSVKLPKTVQTLGVMAFAYCAALKSVTLSEAMTMVEPSTFFQCEKLSTIVIPNGLTCIDSWAFAKCTSLKSITLPDSVTGIEDYAFEDCTSLKSITLPDSVTDIKSWAFSGVPKTCVFKLYVGSTVDQCAETKGFKREYLKDYALRFDASLPQNLDLGTEYDITAVAVPSDHGKATYTYKGSNAKVAAVGADGHVVPLKEGALNVTCTMELPNPSGGKALVKKTATSKHKVVDPLKLTGIKIAFPTVSPYIIGANSGNTWSFRYAISPSTASPVNVTWKSSNAKVATVDSSGKVTPLAKGSATITATAEQGKTKKSASVKVTVVDPDKIHSVKAGVTDASLKVGETTYAGVQVWPADLRVDSYAWTLSNAALAAFTTDDTVGIVRLEGKKKGSVTVTCTVTKDGVSKKASTKVKIVE